MSSQRPPRSGFRTLLFGFSHTPSAPSFLLSKTTGLDYLVVLPGSASALAASVPWGSELCSLLCLADVTLWSPGTPTCIPVTASHAVSSAAQPPPAHGVLLLRIDRTPLPGLPRKPVLSLTSEPRAALHELRLESLTFCAFRKSTRLFSYIFIIMFEVFALK